MALWCRNFPTISMAQRADAPKPFTLILPYYCNPKFLRYQLDEWRTYPVALAPYLQVIVVDDCSPGTSAREVITTGDLPGFPITAHRLKVDIRWNWLACRNIGAERAVDGWLLLTDMDHVLPVPTLERLVHGLHDPRVVYAFKREEHTGVEAQPHSASFFLTRQLFWQIGGYDETLSGYYGTDGEFRRRVAQHAPIQILTDKLIRHEYQQDSSTTTYLRKQPEDAAVGHLLAQRKKGWTPKVLSFPYEQVYP